MSLQSRRARRRSRSSEPPQDHQDGSLLNEDDAYVLYIEYEGGWLKRNITWDALLTADDYWYDVDSFLEYEADALVHLFTNLYTDYPRLPCEYEDE